eukprot:CAMPEP_0195613902 /NCGR_PEP_ID=MMETSP0815-20121206/11664_1 /TAXON_ID=97485 /ORGANISM="Prymnesium parvum, Strain Texoma1" /LENGTH=275 /DNA_ID=CAMNT_0040754137 /DNA_START=335 /DNA_END=1166 /DNA_ORIENTATION=-
MGTRYDDEERRDRSRSRSPYRDGGRDREGGGGRGGSVTSGGGGGGGGGKDQGVALRWNAERGFGFIKPDDGGEDLFCHYSSITDGGALEEGSKVWYTKSYDDRKGKDRAENVTGGIPESADLPAAASEAVAVGAEASATISRRDVAPAVLRADSRTALAVAEARAPVGGATAAGMVAAGTVAVVATEEAEVAAVTAMAVEVETATVVAMAAAAAIATEVEAAATAMAAAMAVVVAAAAAAATAMAAATTVTGMAVAIKVFQLIRTSAFPNASCLR